MSLRTFASATLEKIILNLVFRYSLKKISERLMVMGGSSCMHFSEQN